MQMLAGLRWVFLGAALVLGSLYALTLINPALQIDVVSLEAATLGGALLEILGVYAMRTHTGRIGWPGVLGVIAAVLLVAACLSAMAGVAAGPGGLVYGILILLPSLAIAPVLQILAIVGYFNRESASR